MKKGFAMPIIQSVLGVAVLIILTATVILPQIYAPTNPAAATPVTNSTTVNVAKNFAAFQTFTLSNPVASDTVTFAVTFQTNGSTDRAINLTTRAGTFLASLGATSPQNVQVSGVALSNGLNTFNFTSNNTGSNVTATILSFNSLPQATQQGWDTQTLLIWGVLGLGVVIGVLVRVFSMAG